MEGGFDFERLSRKIACTGKIPFGKEVGRFKYRKFLSMVPFRYLPCSFRVPFSGIFVGGPVGVADVRN